jgi:predicted acetyltransferase
VNAGGLQSKSTHWLLFERLPDGFRVGCDLRFQNHRTRSLEYGFLKSFNWNNWFALQLGLSERSCIARLRSFTDTNGGGSAILKSDVSSDASIMTNRPTKLFDNVAVLCAGPEQEPVLANLLELYVHEFSEFRDIEIGSDGRFGYSRLPLYWSEAGRYPFLVRVNGTLAGLILVKRGSEVSGDATVFDMAEFFILRGYRRCGIGTQVAHQVWKQFPGRWEVRVIESNLTALRFWGTAISKFTGETVRPTPIERGTECWRLFLFESK